MKKILAVLLVLVLTLGVFAACGKQSDTAENNDADASATQDDAAETVAPADGLQIGAVKMEPNKVYNIPATLWHNTVTQKDTKMILIEDSSTSNENSDILPLTPEQIGLVQDLAR